LTNPADLHEQLLRSGLQILGLAPDHALAVADLPLHHRDPFDRLIIAQARAERLTVLTGDSRFEEYGVAMIDATL